MIYYAVIDTNVLVSAMLKADSTPGMVLKEALGGSMIPLICNEIIEEYRAVLSRPKFNFDTKAVQVLLDGLIARAITVDAGQVEDVLPDPKDAVFYEVVMEHRKSNDAYLVTGNIKHFPARPYVVTPREMVDIIQGEQGY